MPAPRLSDPFGHHPSGPQTVPQSFSSPRAHFPLPGCPSCSGEQLQPAQLTPEVAPRMAAQWPSHGSSLARISSSSSESRPGWTHPLGAPREIPHILLSFGSSCSHGSQLTFKISLNSWLIYFISRASNLWKYILKNQTECTLLIAGPFSDISKSKWAFVPSGVLSHDWTPIKGFKNIY